MHNLLQNTWSFVSTELHLLIVGAKMGREGKGGEGKGKEGERKRKGKERERKTNRKAKDLFCSAKSFWTFLIASVCYCFCTNSAYLLLLTGRERTASLHPEETEGGNYPGLN